MEASLKPGNMTSKYAFTSLIPGVITIHFEIKRNNDIFVRHFLIILKLCAVCFGSLSSPLPYCMFVRVIFNHFQYY